MRQTLHASLWQEGEWFVAQCLEVDVSSQGGSKEKALQSLAEAIRLHFRPPRVTVVPRTRELDVEKGAA